MDAAGALNATDRSEELRHVGTQRFDLIVIGAGVTGAGIARQAASSGLSTVVLDANDFAAGTSSRSTKLIHGGLRYLAMGDIGLVRDSALERKAVHALAPHLAEPAWMLLPCRSRASLWKFRAGLATYERLGAVSRRDRHRSLRKGRLAEAEPALRIDRFPFGCAYREYLTDDARLVLALLRAARTGGARALSYLRVEGFLHRAGRLDGVRARCALGDVELEIRGRAVINAAGPWVETLDLSRRGRLHLSKGVHVVLPWQRLPVRNMVMVTKPDGRIVFVIPRGDVTYVGTTDTSYGERPDLWPEVTAVDADYLLDGLAGTFDVAPLARRDVIASWAGLRPLINQPGKAAREMSRRDEVWVREDGLVTIAGGKLTGFRPMAMDALAGLEGVLGDVVRRPDPMTPLPGGDHDGIEALTAVLETNHRLAAPSARRLARLYGSEAHAVAADGSDPIAPGVPVLPGEIRRAVTVDGALTLSDLVYRRLRIAWFEPGCVPGILDRLADDMAAELGWDASERARQLAAVRERLAADLAFR